MSAKGHQEAPKFSTKYMDVTADPRGDFYQYAVGGWLRTHPLPQDKSWYGSFAELGEWNFVELKKICERCARESGNSSDPVVATVGGFYRSALEVKRTQATKFTSIDDLWNLAEGVSSPENVARVIPLLHKEGVETAFNSYSKPDDKNSGVYAFFFEQGGLSLPDREYYLAKSFAKVRRQYHTHLARMFRLKGLPISKARRWANAVLRVETTLARAGRTRTELREAEKNYNRAVVGDLRKRFPSLGLAEYLESTGVPSTSCVIVRQPEFYGAVDKFVARGDIDDWRAYLCWSVLHTAAPFLHSDVEEESFDFFRRKLAGQKKPEPRWKRAIRSLNAMVGEALGKLYVEDHFPEEAGRRASLLVDDLRSVFTRRLQSLPWMSESTRRQALKKFGRFRVKIGHPARFRDYSSITIDPQDYAGNARRAAAFEFHRQAVRVGGIVDKDEWQMSPQEVNAYFDQTMNEIVFPAGILQPPYFDHNADDSVNYGAIGAVIGHEITHGYDDQGRKYDAEGNLRDWWTKEDKKEFNRRARSLVKAYSAETVLPGLHANGKLTLGENIADFGGVSLAFEALHVRLADSGNRNKNGLTPEQRFFVSYAQIWREVMSEAEVRRATTTETHSLGKLRAVLPATHHPAFDRAFLPKQGVKGRTTQKIGVW